MDAVEFLRQRARMCDAIHCHDCELWDCDPESNCMGEVCENPERSVEIVRRWAEAHPVEPGIVLTAMERRFVNIYIEKGYLWAARDKDGELNLYKREPKRGGDLFINTSPSLNGSRTVTCVTFSGITWANSPVCLPKLLEKE